MTEERNEPRRTQRTRISRVLVCASTLILLSSVSSVVSLSGQAPDEATRLLSQYVSLDTSNPPGDTRKTADFLAGVMEREGIPVTRYESEPGKAIVYGR